MPTKMALRQNARCHAYRNHGTRVQPISLNHGPDVDGAAATVFKHFDVDTFTLPEPFAYAPHLARLSRADGHRGTARGALRRAICGQPIEVFRIVDLITLAHAWDRMPERSAFTLARKTIEDSRWLVILIPKPCQDHN